MRHCTCSIWVLTRRPVPPMVRVHVQTAHVPATARRRAVNLKQLSQTLGLSQTTVSRALNGYPEVSAATKARVVAAAKRHDYTPNTRAKSLATGQAMAIGHVLPTATRFEMVNPIFADFIAGAATSYARHGYEMLLSVVEDGDEAQAYRAMKARGLVDGVILHAPRMDDPRIAMLDDIGLPFAVHGRASAHAGPYCWLDVDNGSAFRRAADYLLGLGHTRIALINGLEQYDFAHRRRNGYVAALAARGIAPDPAIMASDEMTEVFGYDSTRRMMAQDTPPTAYLVASIICALGVRRAIEEAGLRMGRDVSVVPHDDVLSYLRNGGTPPIFTAMRASVREAGARLADMLVARIDRPGAAPETCRMQAELTIGGSSGPPPA